MNELPKIFEYIVCRKEPNGDIVIDKDNFEQLKSKIAGLEGDVEGLEDEVENLEDEVEKLDVENDDLMEKNNEWYDIEGNGL